LKKTLPFFSYLFHPIFIPLLGTIFYVLFEGHYFTQAQYLILFLQIIIITFLLPIAFFYLLRTFGKIDTIMLSDLSHRKIPLLLHIMLLTILIEKSVTIDRFPSLYFFFLGGIFSAFFAFMLLYAKMKASIHMIGMSSLTVFIIGLSIKNEINTINLVTFLVIMNGLVASSRLEMKAHSNKELLIGYLCGFVPQITLLYFWL
jgi:membrane-associated HD superfamily phosphohydrolase